MNDDTDILLTLNPNGWITCWILKRDDRIEIAFAYAFSDPFHGQ